MNSDELFEKARRLYSARFDDPECREEAKTILRALANDGHRVAAYMLADIVEFDGGDEYETILERVAIEHGDTKAAMLAGIAMMKRMDYGDKSIDRPLKLLFMAAEDRWVEAIVELGAYYLYYRSDDKAGYERAFKLLRLVHTTRLVSLHDSAMKKLYELLGRYELNQAKECNSEDGFKEAFEAFDLAYRYGSTVACGEIGKCYFNGLGTAVDYGKALEFFRTSEHLANSKAYIGRCLLGGLGCEMDKALGIEYLRLAASENDADGMYYLALSTIHGNGVEADKVEGLRLMREAYKVGKSMDAFLYLEENCPKYFEE